MKKEDLHVVPDKGRTIRMESIIQDGKRYRCLGITKVFRVDKNIFKAFMETERLETLEEWVMDDCYIQYLEYIDNVSKAGQINFKERLYMIAYFMFVRWKGVSLCKDDPRYKGDQIIKVQFIIGLPC